MGNLRTQAITSSLLVYIGFLIGAANIYFFTKQGLFTPEQFGLTRVFYDLGQNIYIFASLGLIPLVYKFYPYYKSNLERRKIDLLTWVMCGALAGFVLVLIGGYIIKPLMIRKFTQRSPLVVEYYYYIYLFAFGMLFFSVLEAYCWSLGKSVWTNFLKETGMRAVVLVIILLYYFKLASFHTFIQLFTFAYFTIFVATLLYLIKLRQFYLVFTPSIVTKKFKPKMLGMAGLVYGGMIVQAVAQTIDTIMIASLRGLVLTGVFSLAQYAANMVQVPQRSMQSVTTSVLSQAWKDKNYEEINRIYHRTSINLLLMALFIFGNLWLNISAGIEVLQIQAEYQGAITVMAIMGITRIIDAGTGVNGTIIATSAYWRFDFLSGVVMLGLRIPLTYILIKNYGLIGAAIAELCAFTLYNAIRFQFLRSKFGMQPFTIKTVYAFAVAAAAYAAAYLLFQSVGGWIGIVARGGLFSIVIIAGILQFNITPDATQLWQKLRSRKR